MPTDRRDARVGGQAVIEGVMMRGARSWAVAMRTPGGDIEIVTRTLDPPALRHRALRLPVIRGVVALGEAMKIGFRALGISANAQLEGSASDRDPADERALGAAGVLVLAVAIGLFFVLPAGVALIAGIGTLWLFLTVETALRLGILIGYVGAINRSAGLRRTLEYHGAEHKAISCLEAGDRLVPERAALHSRLHPRCGTSFLLSVMVLATLVFAPVGLPAAHWVLLSRVVGIPIAVGIAYEAIRWTAGHRRGPAARTLARPGLMLQRLTTREPDREQLEVAIAALERVLAGEASEPRPPGEVEVVG